MNKNFPIFILMMSLAGYNLELPKSVHIIHFTKGPRYYTVAYDYNGNDYWYGATIYHRQRDNVNGHRFNRHFGNTVALNRLNLCPVALTVDKGDRKGRDLHRYLQSTLVKALVRDGVKGVRLSNPRYKSVSESDKSGVKTSDVKVKSVENITSSKEIGQSTARLVAPPCC